MIVFVAAFTSIDGYADDDDDDKDDGHNSHITSLKF